MTVRVLFAAAVLSLAACASAATVTVVPAAPGYHTSLANHVQRWLKGHGIGSAVAPRARLAAECANARLVFLIGIDNPSAGELAALKGVRARGGRLVVFYSASPALGALMGVRPLGFQKASAPGRWSRMDFAAKRFAGCPASILQTSSVLQRAAPVRGRSFALAAWSDRAGRPTGDAAWIQSDAGWWMTHVLLADGDERLKAQLLAAMCAVAVPGSWNARAAAAREAAEGEKLLAFARAQVPKAGEIHAVWDHSGCGLYPGDWPRTVRLLKDRGVTDLFVNVAGAGFAHYASGVLPRSAIFAQEGDQLAAAVAAARGTGLRVHAWILCFTATRATPDRLEAFRKRGWRLRTVDGKLSEYLDPSNPEVRAHVLAALAEMSARYAVDGIHLDFVRWYERGVKPKNAAAVISSFVAAARAKVPRAKWLSAAVLGKYPSCVGSVGQDWSRWLDAGTVDYVVPMDYTESDERLLGYLRQHAANPSHAARTIVGLGVTANESRLTARRVIEQAKLARACGMAGVALFDLDVTLEKQVLPALRLGLWR